MKKTVRLFLCTLSLCLFLVSVCSAQDTTAVQNALAVFLDCERQCDNNFIRQEVTYINYVRDRQDADVHLLVTTQGTGSGGTEYTLNYIGLGDFADMSTVLTYASSGTNTDDERRRGLVRVLVMGLIPFISQTPQAQQVTINVEDLNQDIQQQEEEDPWKNWVFRVGMQGGAEGERSERQYQLGGNLQADKITDDWKIRLRANGEVEERTFEIRDEKQTFTSREGTLSGLVARSLGPHWSVGMFGEVNTSSFANTNLSMELAPGIEYNIFPYSESTRREFRFTYRLNLRSFDYEEETIFGQTAETRLHQSLQVSFDVQQPWGQANASLQASNYLHDFNKYRISLFTRLEFQLIRGLSFNVFGRVARVRDQLFLSAEGATAEEILLNQRQLRTGYEFDVRIGFSYRFGSIFNNTVNSRFGGGGFFF